MKYVAAILFVLSLLGTTGYLAYDYGYNKSEAKWQGVRADTEESAREAFQKVVADRDALQGKIDSQGVEHAKEIAKLRDDNVRALRRERVRASLNAACADKGLPTSTEAAGGDNDSTRGNELRRKIGEELERTALIADMQARRLLGCQRFVRIITE